MKAERDPGEFRGSLCELLPAAPGDLSLPSPAGSGPAGAGCTSHPAVLPGEDFVPGLQSPARRGRSCCYWQAQQELKYVSSFASLQTAPAGRTVPSSTPLAKRKKLQEAAKCVQLLELCPGEAAQLLLQERQEGSSSTARPPSRPLGALRLGLIALI